MLITSILKNEGNQIDEQQEGHTTRCSQLVLRGTTTTPKSSRFNGVWGDPDVHDLTPTRTRHIERSVPIDPQKIFFSEKRFENVCK